MGHAGARNHLRVAKDGWRAGEAVEEPDSGAKKNRRDVDVDFVEEARIQALLDDVSAVDPNGLPAGGGLGLAHGAFDAISHEVDSRVGSRPSGGDGVGQDECGPPGVISAPALGDLGCSFQRGETVFRGAHGGDERVRRESTATRAPHPGTRAGDLPLPLSLLPPPLAAASWWRLLCYRFERVLRRRLREERVHHLPDAFQEGRIAFRCPHCCQGMRLPLHQKLIARCPSCELEVACST